MSICYECGDIELIFVPSCGDPAIGTCLFVLDKAQKRQLDEEANSIKLLFDGLETAKAEKEPQQVIEAQDAITRFLDNYINPASSLPIKHLTQVYNVRGSLWTYVRSDKLKNHVKRYPLTSAHLIAETKTLAQGKKQLDRKGLKEEFSKLKEKIVSEFSKGVKYNGKIIVGSFDATITDFWDVSWLKWVDAVNESMLYQGGSDYHDISAGAQLLRAYAGYGANAGYNPSTGTYGLNAQANARFSLAEAKAEINGYLPHKDGYRAYLGEIEDDAQHSLDFGYFRMRATLTANAMLGASIMGTAGLEYHANGDGSTLARGATANAKGGVSAAAFAGVEAGGMLMGAIEWDNPEQRLEKKKNGWKALFDLGAGLNGALGIGAGGDFEIGLDKHNKLHVRAKAQVVVGLGGSGMIVAGVGLGVIYEFIMYLYHQLKDNNYSLLIFISEAAFSFIIDLVIMVIDKGIEFIEQSYKELSVMINDVLEHSLKDYSNASDAENFAINVKNRPDVLFFSPPEAKGSILYRLSETFTFSFEEHQEAAILVVLSTVQSKREWAQIVERITPKGTKSTAAEGLSRLNYIMDGGNNVRFARALTEIESSSVRFAYKDTAIIRHAIT
jgi:hypothetical protein